MRKKTHPVAKARLRRKTRVRKHVKGTADRPRLSVFRSSRHIYGQIVDDERGVTLASASTRDKSFQGKTTGTIEAAGSVGRLLAERAQAQSIGAICFDRGGYLYHGRVKALAESIREAGLKF